MPTGVATTYDLTVGVRVNMDEAIYLISPLDSPLLTGLNSDGLSVLSTAPVDEREFSWLDEEILTPRTTLNGAVTTGDTFITVATGDRTKFSTGDVLVINKAAAAETLRVTGYGTTADTLLTTRGYEGSTATNYASAAVVAGVGTALAEGSDPEAARTKDRTERSNVTQIFGPTKLEMSRTEQKVRKYGVANEFAHQLQNRVRENVIGREQAYLYGVKTNSTTTKIRTTGGIKSFVTSNVDSTSTQLTVTKIQTLQQTNYDAGGLPEILIARPNALADLNDISNTSIVRVDIDDARRGRRSVEQVWTEFGPISIVRNRWVFASDAFLIKRAGVIRRIFDPLMIERLAKTGDADKVQLVCEEGLEVKGQTHMARFSALVY